MKIVVGTGYKLINSDKPEAYIDLKGLLPDNCRCIILARIKGELQAQPYKVLLNHQLRVEELQRAGGELLIYPVVGESVRVEVVDG